MKMPAPALTVTEKQFQEKVVALARLCGWRCYHTFDSRRSEPGFPDLTMVRGGKIVFAELKVGKKEPSPEQVAWLKDLALGGGNKVACYVWKPDHWDEINDVLQRRQRRAK